MRQAARSPASTYRLCALKTIDVLASAQPRHHVLDAVAFVSALNRIAWQAGIARNALRWRRVARRQVTEWRRDPTGTKTAPVASTDFPDGPCTEVTAAVVFSRLRGAGAGILCRAGLPPGLGDDAPAVHYDFPLTTSSRRALHAPPVPGRDLALGENCDWSMDIRASCEERDVGIGAGRIAPLFG